VRSIRWKLMLVTLVLVFVPVYFLNRYSIATFDKFTSRVWEDQMISTARMVGELVVRSIDSDGLRSEVLHDVSGAFSDETGMRIRLVDPTGALLYDSAKEIAPGTLFTQHNEVKVALTGEYKARWELTDDRSYVYFHSAQPVLKNGTVLGVVYISRHTGPITGALIRISGNQNLATYIALAVAACVAALLSHTLTHRLRKLTRAATAYAQGEAGMPVRVGGHDEIGELTEAFNRMAAEIDRRNRANKEFMSVTVHELKTPITAIRGAAELLEQGAVEQPATREKFLSNIRHEAQRLDRLVSELKEITRLDLESFHESRKRVDYVQLVRDIANRLEPVFDDERAELVLDLPEKEIHAEVMAARIEQVIANLLENAFRYTRTDGKVEIIVREEDDGTVLTSVRDSGAGISAENLPKVFDRFFTTEPRDQPREYGSGLGLAIARSIVENHQGDIRVTSNGVDYTEFTFRIPVASG
jgi:two-component system sensor histidine kinase ChvG